MKNTITFDKKSIPFVLEILGVKADLAGYICKGGKRVKARDGQPIKVSDFAGVTRGARKGKMIFWRNDMVSLIFMSDAMEAQEKNP